MPIIFRTTTSTPTRDNPHLEDTLATLFSYDERQRLRAMRALRDVYRMMSWLTTADVQRLRF